MTGKIMTGVPVSLRRRSGWEAADMGILLWRLNWKPILLFFSIPFGLCALILKLLPFQEPGEGSFKSFLLWWIFPFLDRFVLQVVSVRFFNPRASVKQLFTGLGRTLWRGLAGDLLWRRFSPFRSARMPVTVLEEFTGRQLYQRKQLLSRNGLDFGLPLTLICLGLEIILGLGEFAFVFSMGQIFFPQIFPGGISVIDLYTGSFSILSIINHTLIGSLYVCMGFGLYINSRIETEGWDIELLFKEITQKKGLPGIDTFNAGAGNPSPGAPRGLLLGLFLFLGTAFVFPQAAEAEAPGGQEISAELLLPEKTAAPESAALDQVLASPDFGYYKQTRQLWFKPNSRGLFRWSPPGDFSGKALRVAVIIILAAALGISAYTVLRHKRFFQTGKQQGALEGRTKKPQEDPQSLLEQAERLYGEGRIREGWACCLRAFMAVLIRRGLPLSDETTEYEALALARGKPDIQAGILESFIRRWTSFAYGGRDPGKEIFEASVKDCRVLYGAHDPLEQDGGTR
ncbi:MAG: DUF4129 domain-containing protein [Spirochaetaceae bacterium]|jgi:hypothetical protein|nr:DUF4129 domain-containing protein [Spirochaetaceae bacterium]